MVTRRQDNAVRQVLAEKSAARPRQAKWQRQRLRKGKQNDEAQPGRQRRSGALKTHSQDARGARQRERARERGARQPAPQCRRKQNA